jgi:hypothetical protein
MALCTISRFDQSEFANLAKFGVFSLGDRIHPGVITAVIAVITRLQVLEQYLKIRKFTAAVLEYRH